jgi:hypothetical protein
MSYRFDENTMPKEIIAFAMFEIADMMKPDGFAFAKSKLEIKKKTEAFIFSVYPQSNRWNKRGYSAEMWLHCAVQDHERGMCFWSHTLAVSNAKQDSFRAWELYGKENYTRSLETIREIIEARLLPFFRRFENDLEGLTDEVSRQGFCVFADSQVYDADYKIPTAFLLRYGTKSQLNRAFQVYVNSHQLDYVKPKLHRAIAMIKDGLPVSDNGEKRNAEFAVEHGLEIVF